MEIKLGLCYHFALGWKVVQAMGSIKCESGGFDKNKKINNTDWLNYLPCSSRN